VARESNGTSPGQVAALRDACFDDAQIVALTVYVAGRLAFSAVNSALGTRPDAEYRTPSRPSRCSRPSTTAGRSPTVEWRRGESNP
jgi:hypothetical protein